jgi:hypothetical protein
LVFEVKGLPQANGIGEKGGGEYIWVKQQVLNTKMERFHNKYLHDLYFSLNVLVESNEGERNKWGMWQFWRKKTTHTSFCWGSLNETDHTENLLDLK